MTGRLADNPHPRRRRDHTTWHRGSPWARTTWRRTGPWGAAPKSRSGIANFIDTTPAIRSQFAVGVSSKSRYAVTGRKLPGHGATRYTTADLDALVAEAASHPTGRVGLLIRPGAGAVQAYVAAPVDAADGVAGVDGRVAVVAQGGEPRDEPRRQGFTHQREPYRAAR